MEINGNMNKVFNFRMCNDNLVPAALLFKRELPQIRP